MAKNDKPVFFCGECGYESPRWVGKCPACDSWNTMVEAKTVKVQGARVQSAKRLLDVQLEEFVRSSTGMQELDRVLGGGLAPGMVVLLGGDPGIGKSTLLLQVAGHVAASQGVLYVSGEESQPQIKHRALRLNIGGDIHLLCETDFATIEAEIERLSPGLIVVDSIQTMYCAHVPGATGSVSQVREVTALLTKLAKRSGAIVWIVGHVTKEGGIAGPRILEHMVDIVLYFEGERHADLRLLRAVKNRFGSTNEMGVFEMREAGMVPVKDPSFLFLSGQHLPGCAVSCVLEGTRPMLVEVQSLLAQSAFGSPRRTCAGIDSGRLALLLAVLENKARLRLSDRDVYLNVIGGLRIMDRASDLGIALCIASSYKDVPLKPSTAALGEIGLTGEVRAVSQMEKRMRECVRLGFANIIVPRVDGLPQIEGAQLLRVRNVLEAVALL